MKLMQVFVWAALVVSAALTVAAGSRAAAIAGQPRPAFAGVLDDHPAIRYATTPSTDRVARLMADVSEGKTALSYREAGGYLAATLRALDVAPESQLLVFSKTGVQRADTGPNNPRALYFDDSVVVGYIPGARFIEIAAHDRELGVVFYTIDQAMTQAAAITRRTDCLTCHVSGSTLDVPGLITRSNFTNPAGEILPQLGFTIVDHRTPLSARWGGWFVTGKYDLAPYGGVTHMGNIATALHPVHPAAAGASNEIFIRWMQSNVESRGYASHDSDIAALMIFDHQMRAMNLLTRLNWEARVALQEERFDLTSGELRELVDSLAEYLLFVDEASPPARLTPRAGFAARFAAAGPRDTHGRSLRELDLNQRLFKYPCSYMIYSAAFDGLPPQVKHAVYGRLAAILASTDTKYAHLSATDRRAISEILKETKADWPSSR